MWVTGSDVLLLLLLTNNNGITFVNKNMSATNTVLVVNELLTCHCSVVSHTTRRNNEHRLAGCDLLCTQSLLYATEEFAGGIIKPILRRIYGILAAMPANVVVACWRQMEFTLQ